MTWIYQTLGWISIIIFIYFIIVQFQYFVLLLFSIPDLFQRCSEMESEDYMRLWNSDATPPISVIIPAHNEAQTIQLTVDLLLHLYYRHKEIVIVNDGSTDGTLEILKKNYDLVMVPPVKPQVLQTQEVFCYYRSKKYPELVVVDKKKGGRVDTLNVALNVCTSPIYIAIDADTVVPENSLLRLIRPFVTDSNIAAIGGAIGIGNNCTFEGHQIKDIRFPKNFLAGFQVIEYLRSFIFGRVGWNHFGGPLNISGAFGVFSLDLVKELGGYKVEYGDDMELTLRIHRVMTDQKRPYKIKYLADVIAWTEAPTKLASLENQRARWQRGLMDAIWANKIMGFKFKYGWTGTFGWPYLFFVEGLSPFIEFGGYIVVFLSVMLNAIYWEFAAWLLALALLYPMVLGFICLVLDDLTFNRFSYWRDFWKVSAYIIMEQLGYRQYLVWVRLKAMFRWLLNIPETWPAFGREGFKN